MNWVDYAIIFIILANLANGLRVGFTKQFAGLLGVVIGIWAAFNYYPQSAIFLENTFKLSNYISPAFGSLTSTVLNVIGFFAVYSIINLAFAIVAMLSRNLLEAADLSYLDRIGGGALGFVKAIVIVTLIVRIFTVVSVPSLSQSMMESRFVPKVDVLGTVLFRQVQEAFPADLMQYPDNFEFPTQAI